jgi:hypothetical protein
MYRTCVAIVTFAFVTILHYGIVVLWFLRAYYVYQVRPEAVL